MPPSAASVVHSARCLAVLDSALNGAALPPLAPCGPEEETLWQGECGLFVTLKSLKEGGHSALRGCIGSLSPQPLRALDAYARKAAFEDGRFSPLSAPELHTLELSVSLLVDMEPAAHALDWQVGTHGTILEITHAGTYYKATFLPEVAVEARWSQADTIAALLRKAGCPHLPQAAWRDIAVTRYRSSKATLTYADWVASAR